MAPDKWFMMGEKFLLVVVTVLTDTYHITPFIPAEIGMFINIRRIWLNANGNFMCNDDWHDYFKVGDWT